MPPISTPLVAPRRNVVLWRGDDDPPVQWVFGDDSTDDTILTGSEFELTIEWGEAGRLVIASTGEDGGLDIDVEARMVTWPYTTAQTAQIDVPRGAYELRRIYEGTRRTWARGAVIMLSELRT